MEGLSGIIGFVEKLLGKSLVPAITVCFVCIAVIYLPDKWLPAVILQHLDWARFALICVACYFFASLLLWAYRAADKLWRCRQSIERVRKSLRVLTAVEKRYLLLFIQSDEPAIYFEIEDSVAWGLLEKRILYMPSKLHAGGRAGFNLGQEARTYLINHPELLNEAASSARISHEVIPGGRLSLQNQRW